MDVSDKYRGIRFSADSTVMINVSDSKIEEVPEFDNEVDLVVPDYIFSEFITKREKYIVADSLLYDLNEFNLIPDFDFDYTSVKQDTSKFGLNIKSGASMIYDNLYSPINLTYFNYDNFDAKIKFDHFFPLSKSDLKINGWNEISSFLSILKD